MIIRCQRCKGEVALRVLFMGDKMFDEHYCVKCGEILQADGSSITRLPDGRRMGWSKYESRLAVNE